MILPRRKISSMFVLSVGIVSTLFCWMTRDAHALQEATVQKTEVRREHNLDHWDSDTLAYYLDNYPGYDLAIMFYARWDTNSQRLAPYWNRIAEILDAGSNQSKLIMVSASSWNVPNFVIGSMFPRCGNLRHDVPYVFFNRS